MADKLTLALDKLRRIEVYGKCKDGFSAEDAFAVMNEITRLQKIEQDVNTPHTAEFLRAVQLEAVHQRERWAASHDAGKTDADWFWLVGYLVGKALHKPEKQVHHIITTAAALLNWHAAKTGSDTRMRPGIAQPDLGGAQHANS